MSSHTPLPCHLPENCGGEGLFLSVCWDSARPQTAVFSGAWSPLAVALCVFHQRRNWGQMQWRALLPGSRWGDWRVLSYSPHLLSLTSSCQSTWLWYCLFALGIWLTSRKDRAELPAGCSFLKKSWAVCRTPVGNHSLLCLSTAQFSSVS